MTRAEYAAAMRDVSKLAARTEIEAARKTRAVIIEALKPVIAAVRAGRRPSGIDKPKLAEDIIGVARTEGMKPVEKTREIRAAIEKSFAERYGLPVPPAPPRPVVLENARKKPQTDWRMGRAYGYGMTKKSISAYTKDPETGKITWSDAALSLAFTKRYDLSALVWASVEEMEEEIFNVINGGLALARDPVDIAKDLETYIKYPDGGKRVAGRWGAMFPNTDAGIKAAREREYLAFHDIQPGSEEHRRLFHTPISRLSPEEAESAGEARGWLKSILAEKTQRDTTVLPDQVKQYARRIGKAGLDYRAIRIVRTDTAAMLADEQTDFAKNSYAATGKVDWVLKSGREKWGCKCAEYAAGGPYFIDRLPAQIPVHPNCFVPDTKILTPSGYKAIKKILPGEFVVSDDGAAHQVTAIYKTLYNGKIIRLNKCVGSTPEHPVSSNGKFIEAQALNKGDNFTAISANFRKVFFTDFISSNSPSKRFKEGSFIVVADNLFFSAFVPMTTVYFNGDFYIGECDVDVIFSYCEAGNWTIAEAQEFFIKHGFINTRQFTLLPTRPAFKVNVCALHAFNRFMGGFGVRLPSYSHISVISLAHRRGFNANRAESGVDCHSVNSKYFSNRINRQAVFFKKDSQSFKVDVFFDTHKKIVSKSQSQYKGYVYNLTVSDTNTFFANGMLVHNCDCELRPILKSAAELEATFKTLAGID